MDTKKIETVLTTVTIDSKVDSGKIDVVVGESAKMDVVKAVNYIQSGKAEIEKAVQQGKQELDTEGQIYVDLAKDWAIKTDGTVDGSEYSSKYWAEQSASAAATVGNGTITITQDGVTKGTFTTNQSGNTTIALDQGGTVDQTYDGTSSNAQSGIAIEGELSNYVQSSSLATVATSGLYSDLSGKPNYGAGLSYSSSSLQLLDQNGNNLGSAVTIKSTPDLDGVTIDTNSDDELEAIGVIDNNGNAIKTWTGTLAQYNAIATKDPNTLYNITDDMSVPQTILETLYPVGSLYIGKMSTCPLASLIPNSTWTLVASDKVLQGSGTYTAGTSVSAGLPDFEAVFVNHARDYNPQTDRSLTPVSGAIAVKSNKYPKSSYPNVSDASAGNYKYDQTLEIRPSISNSIYGNSTTVQPPAYVVNIWERTA